MFNSQNKNKRMIRNRGYNPMDNITVIPCTGLPMAKPSPLPMAKPSPLPMAKPSPSPAVKRGVQDSAEKPATSEANNNAGDKKDGEDAFRPQKVDASYRFPALFMPKIAAKDYWHKFIILKGAVCERTQVLKTVINAVHRTEFIPVLYRTETPHATFLARDCTAAISKLFQNKFRLLLDGCTTADKMIHVEVILCFIHVNLLGLSVNDHLRRCATKRYNERTETLDLSNFSEDPELTDTCYCPLWLPTVLSSVLVEARALGKPIFRMNLRRNALSALDTENAWADFNLLKRIDLSENELDSVESLEPLQCLKLTELVLDKNPLCAWYTNAANYTREVRACIPTLKKLDGVHLRDQALPQWTRNHVSTPEGVDFIDQFLERYFTIYDSENRQWLKGMYHEDACFSMSARYLGGQSTSSTARLTRYTVESRNLLRLSDYSKSLQLLSHGPENVTAVLCRLPRTEHDPPSFCVDLVIFTPSYSVFTVTGVFREPLTMDESGPRFFNRTFVVVKVGNMQYQICNEILFISNSTTKQAKNSFKTTRPTLNLTKMALSQFETLTDADRDRMVENMADLTEMNPRWAKKCLEESKWKFQEALQVFTELLKMDKIPMEAFMKG